MIKNIIFDLGGVIVRLDKNTCIESFKKLGFEDFGSILNEFVQKGPFLDFELGLLTEDEFRSFIRQNIKNNVTDSDIDNAMSDFLVEIPKNKLDTILRLKSSYNVFLLSNTNPIAIKAVKPFFKSYGMTMEDYFHRMFLSYQMKMAKPDVEIFAKVLEIASIKAQETLFIDDGPANLHSASLLGYKTLLATQESDLETEIRSVL
ncbi:MAG: HAD family phosphatase [Bacteroidales bacterium]|jgi:putative hydrolase of the HAD superfamily